MMLKATCERCGGAASASLFQRDHNGRLIWNLGTRCAVHEGHASEVDGWGLPPADLRRLLLAEGTFSLVLDRDTHTVLALRTLQTALDLPATTIARIRAGIPGAIVNGTRPEMDWLAGKLREQNIAVEVAPVGRSSSVPDLSELVPSEWTGKPSV